MAKRWIAVEEDDDNACEPCGEVDGKLYRSRRAAYADYPGGVGYKDCVGAQYGNACRGKVVKRRGAERSDQGMTDIRLLNEFRARIAERNQILSAMKTTVAERPEGASWCKIENASAEEASVYIYDEIGFWGVSAQAFVDDLNAVTAPKITVYINSPGGEVFDGLAIHTALATHKAHITTFVTGIAASAASYIAMAGDTIKMARNATMMIHDASGMAWGNATTMRKQADLLDKLSLNVADMYAMQAGGTVEEWFARIENTETWYTGREALAAGLVDEITDPDEEEVEDRLKPGAVTALSLAAFNFSGRAEAPAPVLPDPPEETPEEGEENEEEQEKTSTPEDAPVTETVEYARSQALAFLAASLRS